MRKKIMRLILLALGLALFAISTAVLIAGCGDSTGDYGLFRSRYLITVFVPIDDTSEVTEISVDHKALHIDIDAGEEIVQRVIPLQYRLFHVVETDETVEIHGENRINGHAVIHLRAFDTKHKVSKFIKLHVSKFYDFRITTPDKKLEPFADSGAFRFGDKIIAYCNLQGNIDSSQNAFKINIGPVEIKHTKATVNTHAITEDVIGERILILENYEIDTDKRVQNLHFLLKDLEPHETIEIEKIKVLGDRIVVAELVVEPEEKQFLKPQPPERISDR